MQIHQSVLPLEEAQTDLTDVAPLAAAQAVEAQLLDLSLPAGQQDGAVSVRIGADRGGADRGGPNDCLLYTSDAADE